MRHDRKKVLIAGAGVAALEAALALRELAGERAELELLAPGDAFAYQPLSVAEPFGLGRVLHLDLDAVASAVGAGLTVGGLTGIDSWRHTAHTTSNADIEYDVLLVASGALPLPVVPGATTFRGAADTGRVADLMNELEAGEISSLAFVVPWGAAWALPAYELALLASSHLAAKGRRDVSLTLVTPEGEPLQLFGAPASEAIAALLHDADVGLRCGTYAREHADGVLDLVPDPDLEVDRVVALPRLQGAPLDGIPQTLSGFVPVDGHCRVPGLADVYAAGDVTSFAVKQGGIATQQADAAAEAIAAALGADIDPQPFRPVLRGLLLTGAEPRYLRRELAGRPGREPVATREPLWWPPAKVVGRRLAPFLAQLTGDVEAQVPPAEPEGVPVEVALGPERVAALTSTRFTPDLRAAEGAPLVGDVMTTDPVLANPDEPLGELAEHLVAHGSTAAIVEEDGRPVGIVTTRDLVHASAARVRPDDTTVRLWMTSEPVTVPSDWPASAAALLMTEYGIHHLPVVDGDHVVGVLEYEQAQGARIPTAAGRGLERGE